MVKEIERTGLPVVHMCTVTPISLTVGANRIIPTIALDHEEEKKLRRHLVDKAIHAFTVDVTEQTVFED